MPVFALTVPKGGPKFGAHKDSGEGNDKTRLGVSIGSGKGKLMATKMSMAGFCDSPGHQVDRIVIDRAGLTGDYDFMGNGRRRIVRDRWLARSKKKRD